MSEKSHSVALQWSVFAVLVLVEVVLGARLLLASTDSGLVVGAMAVVAGLLVVCVRVFDVSSLAVGKDGIRAELDAVKAQVNEVDRRIAQLFLLTMSPAMYFNLEKLASGQFGHYVKNGGLERELFHLRDIGYIDIPYIRQIPELGENLSDHVQVTEMGKRFVALRKEMEKEISALT